MVGIGKFLNVGGEMHEEAVIMDKSIQKVYAAVSDLTKRESLQGTATEGYRSGGAENKDY